MDAKALYPSITGKMAGEAVMRAVRTTTLEIVNINYKMAFRYIAKNAKDDNQVKEVGMSAWCPTRTKVGGNRPGVIRSLSSPSPKCSSQTSTSLQGSFTCKLMAHPLV